MFDRLIARVIETRNPTAVGLDPRPEYIPDFITKNASQHFSDPFQAISHAVFLFNKSLIDALYDIVPAVKPQVAFYELYGAHGYDCYLKTVRYAKGKGLFVIADAKRNDIASSAQAYADAHIGRVALNGQARALFDADFVTLNPYLGRDSVEPFLEAAREYDKGVFVLVKTSNTGSGDIQDIDTPDGKIYEIVAEKVKAWGGEPGKYGYNRAGAVVGATHPAQAEALRARMPNTFFLVPGYGAQGGTAAGARKSFHKNGLGAIVNNSRGIIAAHTKPGCPHTGEGFALAAREAAIKMREDLGFNYEDCQ
ncbi:MAG: orotidine-5'-phosphate decarboxylase [Clostridiales bacterium]|nr:orotidine-5'-phosphate decarboxylase [Clostridiales bacterium]